MAKQIASHRFDEELLAWAASYAKTRGVTRGVVVNEAVRWFRSECESGVPDLPEPDPPAVRREVATRAAQNRVAPARSFVRRDPAAWARQQKMNAAKERNS